MLSTIIIGPPERIRTRSPGWNEVAVWLGVADAAGLESAGTDKGMLRASPSASVVAIDSRFAKISIIDSISFMQMDVGLH